MKKKRRLAMPPKYTIEKIYTDPPEFQFVAPDGSKGVRFDSLQEAIDSAWVHLDNPDGVNDE